LGWLMSVGQKSIAKPQTKRLRGFQICVSFDEKPSWLATAGHVVIGKREVAA